MEANNEELDAMEVLNRAALRVVRLRRQASHPGVTRQARRPCEVSNGNSNGNGKHQPSPEAGEPRSLELYAQLDQTGGVSNSDRFNRFTERLVGDILRGSIDPKAANAVARQNSNTIAMTRLAISKGTPDGSGHRVLDLYREQVQRCQDRAHALSEQEEADILVRQMLESAAVLSKP